MMRRIIPALVSFILPFFFTTRVWAISIPSFPHCVNPQGAVKVSYNEGTHGIVGSTATFTGKDTVYTLSDITLMQCFCAVDGSGTQTNWWKFTSITDDERKILENDGWTYVPNGALWGLAETPYMTKNSSYSCLSHGGIGGSVLGDTTSGDVLGLATTGDSELLVLYLTISIVAAMIGVYLRFHENTHPSSHA